MLSSIWYAQVIKMTVNSSVYWPYLSDLLHLYIPPCSLCSYADTRTFQFQNERKSSKGNALFLIWALSHWINSHTLYACCNKIPVQNSIPLSTWTKLLKFFCFVSAANHTAHPPPPHPHFLLTCLYRCMRAALVLVCMHACVRVCVRACLCVRSACVPVYVWLCARARVYVCVCVLGSKWFML